MVGLSLVDKGVL